MTIKAGIYLRQSSDPNNDQLGVARQRQDCLKRCEDKGWSWVEYIDNDTSATKGRRPEYQQMLADIRNGAIQAVVVWHMDRLHRQPRELEEFILLAEEHHIALVTITGDVDLGSDTGRLVARILGAVARGETERKTARMKRRYLQDAQSGQLHGKTKAFGYTKDNHLDPGEAEALKRAYADVLAGASLTGIAAAWNEAGFTTGRGKAWARTGVRHVLLNPRNAGLRAHNGEIVAEGNWPAIVDRDTFDTVAAKLKDTQRRSGVTNGRKHLMSGIALCSKCGHTLGSAVGRPGTPPRYHCKKCLGTTRRADWVDEYVCDVAAERLSRPDARQVLLERTDAPNLAELRAEADTLRTRQEQMGEAFAEGAVTMTQLRAANERIDAKLADIDAQLVDASKARVLDGLTAATRAEARAKLDGLDLARRRAVINTLMTVTVLPGQTRGAFREDLVQIDWK